MQLTVGSEQEEDGRWLGEVVELPGVLAYGQTRSEAVALVQVLALRVLADRLEHGEVLPQTVDVLPQVFSALPRIGWSVKRGSDGARKVLERPDEVDRHHGL